MSKRIEAPQSHSLLSTRFTRRQLLVVTAVVTGIPAALTLLDWQKHEALLGGLKEYTKTIPQPEYSIPDERSFVGQGWLNHINIDLPEDYSRYSESQQYEALVGSGSKFMSQLTKRMEGSGYEPFVQTANLIKTHEARNSGEISKNGQILFSAENFDVGEHHSSVFKSQVDQTEDGLWFFRFGVNVKLLEAIYNRDKTPSAETWVDFAQALVHETLGHYEKARITIEYLQGEAVSTSDAVRIARSDILDQEAYSFGVTARTIVPILGLSGNPRGGLSRNVVDNADFWLQAEKPNWYNDLWVNYINHYYAILAK